MTRCDITPMRPVQYLLLLAGVLFLWPAFVNTGPFFFSDTPAYVRGVDAAVFHATGIPSDWTFKAHPRAAVTGSAPSPVSSPASRPTPAAGTPQPPGTDKPVLLGRSAYYGIILYLGVAFHGFWAVLLVQGLVAASILLVLLRHVVDPGDGRRFAVAAMALFALLAVTPLPFFVCLLMPDLFSGVTIVAAAVLLLGWKREAPLVRGYLVAILALAALVHSSNVLLLAGFAILFAGWTVIRARRRPGGIARLLPAGALLGCALVGLAGESAFTAAITSITGQSPIRPPFLTARFVDDGPGTAYLRAKCGHSTLVLCRFVDRLPVPSDGFLWDPDPRTGVFMAVSPTLQRRLAAEQLPFVLASVRHAPLATATMLLRDFATQLGKGGLSEFHYNREQRSYFAVKLPAAMFANVRQSPAYRGTFPLAPFETISLLLTIGAALILLSSWLPRSPLAPWAGFATIALGGVLLNDLVCGCLSTPHDRYQMRVIWVLPAVAAVLLIARRADRHRRDRATATG